MKRYFYLLAMFSVVFASACTETAVTPPNNNPGGTNDPNNVVKFDVTWAPETKVIPKSDAGLIRSIDSINYGFTFQSGNPTIDALKNGDIIAVTDFVIRRVTSVQRSGSTVVVATEECKLTDAVTDADIAWDYGVSFTPQFFASAYSKMGRTPHIVTNDSLGVEFSAYGLKHSVSFKFKGESADIVITSVKEAGGQTVAEFRCEGTLNKFRQKGEIKISNRKLMTFENRNNQMNADFTLSATAAGSGNTVGLNVELPVFKFPIPQLPFFVFEIKCQVVLNMVVPPDGSTLLKARFIYEADQGIRYVDGSGFSAIANIRSEKVEKANEPRTGASSPISVSWGLGFPRTGFSLAGTETNVWIQPAYLIGGDYTMLPPCQQAKAMFIGSTGYNLGALGVSLASGSKTLWSKETVLLKVGQCP